MQVVRGNAQNAKEQANWCVRHVKELVIAPLAKEVVERHARIATEKETVPTATALAK
jgi:hypothetical protein